MIQVITATFEDGVLKPEEPLHLLPHSRVRLAVELLEGETMTRQQAWEALEQVWQQSNIDAQGERLSREQLHERH